MPTLTAEAVERSTFVILASFADRNGDAITPTAVTWTLTDADGAVVNSRLAVSVTPTGGTATITLSGDDLAVDGQARVKRVLGIAGTHDGAPVREEVEFFIRPLVDADTELVVSGLDVAIASETVAVTEDA